MLQKIFIFVYCLLHYYYFVNTQNLGGFCRTPSGESAKCISVYECNSILSLIRTTTRSEEQTQFIKSSNCGYNSNKVPFVCCGSGIRETTSINSESETFKFNPLLPNYTDCGWQADNKIFNGERTSLDEFPWMVLIQYLKLNGNKQIACGGSLINQKYILTAAHCVTGKILKTIGQPISVRLGEYDTSSPGTDCYADNGLNYCNQEEVNVNIDKTIPHPNYIGDLNNYNDIALIRLSREVSYSDFIQPICLPLPNFSSRAGEHLTVAGWGKTEKGKESNIKLKLKIPVVDFNHCSNTFNQLNVRLRNQQICAGGERGKDSCKGDSGGPLMRLLPSDSTRWMIEGVVSYGYICGTEGYPGIYTKVGNYISWIHNNVRA